VSRREISPLRLPHYRENWYIDAYYHLRDDIRCSSLGSVQYVQYLEIEALEIDNAESLSALDSGYGIFAGREVYWAGAGIRRSMLSHAWPANQC
jgi:hypothetical protein